MNFKNKIAVFGGSFNPPTKSHHKIIKDLSREFKEVLIVPVFRPPHKNNLVSFDHRVRMLHLLINDLENCTVLEVDKEIAVSNFKNNLDTTNYTCDTMNFLRKKYKEDLVFVSGPDVVIKKYKNHKDIGEFYIYENNFQERSTRFRVAFNKGKYSEARSYLTIPVWDYVVAKKIYDPKIIINKKVVNDGYLPLLDLEVIYDSEASNVNAASNVKVYTRNIIDPKNSIGITLIDPVNNKVLIKREKRFGPYIEEGVIFSYGVIEGTMEKNECPVECALREVEEESGITLEHKNIVLINKWYPSAGYMTEIKHVLVGFFDVSQYERAGDLHGLESENEEIYTELFDVDELLLHHATQGAKIYSPEIASALLYFKFGKI